MPRHAAGQRGFTLVEALMTMALLAGVFALIFVNIGKPQTVASLNGAVETLVADLRTQQLQAMSGDSAGESSAQPHGVYVSSAAYTVFSGASYNGPDPDNYTVTPGQGISFSTTLPGSQVLFNKSSGEVQWFSAGSNTITVTGDEGTRTVTINRFGIVTVE